VLLFSFTGSEYVLDLDQAGPVTSAIVKPTSFCFCYPDTVRGIAHNLLSFTRVANSEHVLG
jgi:hypothetical protein